MKFEEETTSTTEKVLTHEAELAKKQSAPQTLAEFQASLEKTSLNIKRLLELHPELATMKLAEVKTDILQQSVRKAIWGIFARSGKALGLNNAVGTYDDLSLPSLLDNPSVKALLTPKTALEQEVEDMVDGRLKPAEYYPNNKARDKESPIDFTKRIYKKYLAEDYLYLDQLRIIDETLVQALNNWDSRHKVADSAFIPRERARIDKILSAAPSFLKERLVYFGSAIMDRKRKGIGGG